MEDRWREWQTQVLDPLLGYFPGEPFSPALTQLLDKDPAQVDLALLAADTDRTQDYVFESAHLPEIRGSSRLLQELNENLRTIITDRGLPPECVLYAGGGGLLALVPLSQAADLASAMECLYPDRTGVATTTCKCRPTSPAEVVYGYGGRTLTREYVNAIQQTAMGEAWQRVAAAYGERDAREISARAFQQARGFGQMVRLMGVLLRQSKDQPSCRPLIEALPHAVRCQACQIRPAHRLYPRFGKNVPLCTICHTKLSPNARSEQVHDFLAWLEQSDHSLLRARYWTGADEKQVDHAQDLDELGQACRKQTGSRYVGFLYADGNRMGRLLEALPAPQAYREFSDALQCALKDALYQALAENVHPMEIPEHSSPATDCKARGYIHPLEPLMVGGDDLIVMVPGDAAFPVAVRLCQLFEREIKRRVSPRIWESLPQSLRHPTLSAGVVIADSHNPVRVLQELAKELCGSAKCRARHEADQGNPTSALDLLVLKSQSMLRHQVREMRKMPPYCYAEVGHGERRHLGASPYTLAEACRLLDLLKTMRQQDFPTSQLQSVVAALHQGLEYGRIFYLYQQARTDARLCPNEPRFHNLFWYLRQTWYAKGSDALIPWHPLPGGAAREYASVLPDLLELYALVPRSKRAELEQLWQETLMEANHAR